MKLITFTVNSFRSIQSAYKLSLTDYSVLVGPNNEGKSNILNAVVISLQVLSSGVKRRYRRKLRYSYRDNRDRIDYNWERDFPIPYQSTHPDGRSEFILEFELEDIDFQEFRNETGVHFNSNLKIKLAFGSDDIQFDVVIPGKGKKALNQKEEEISDFVRKKIQVQYISALRPSDLALEVVQSMVYAELEELEKQKEYQDLLKKIQEIEAPILSRLGSTIEKSIKEFIPDINSVSIEAEESYRGRRRYDFSIYIEDQFRTQLHLKGDGVISLIAISLIRHRSQAELGSENLILTIEEPESHLHPQAIHRLRQVLKEISKNTQVIITTHSPILVERENLEQNIIIHGGEARPPKSIEEIRNSLGILVSDNLATANFVLLVEGFGDKRILKELLSQASPILKKALARNTLVIEHMAGAGKLQYFASLYKSLLCQIHIFLDSDSEAKNAIFTALSNGQLLESEYHLAKTPGMDSSEIEDLFRPDCYLKAVEEKFGVNLNIRPFKNNSKKWSERVKEVFQLNGKQWSQSVEDQLKTLVADSIVSEGISSIHQNKRSVFDALAEHLSNKIDRA